jgi:hypothetical protein
MTAQRLRCARFALPRTIRSLCVAPLEVLPDAFFSLRMQTILRRPGDMPLEPREKSPLPLNSPELVDPIHKVTHATCTDRSLDFFHGAGGARTHPAAGQLQHSLRDQLPSPKPPGSSSRHPWLPVRTAQSEQRRQRGTSGAALLPQMLLVPDPPPLPSGNPVSLPTPPAHPLLYMFCPRTSSGRSGTRGDGSVLFLYESLLRAYNVPSCRMDEYVASAGRRHRRTCRMGRQQEDRVFPLLISVGGRALGLRRRLLALNRSSYSGNKSDLKIRISSTLWPLQKKFGRCSYRSWIRTTSPTRIISYASAGSATL